MAFSPAPRAEHVSPALILGILLAPHCLDTVKTTAQLRLLSAVHGMPSLWLAAGKMVSFEGPNGFVSLRSDAPSAGKTEPLQVAARDSTMQEIGVTQEPCARAHPYWYASRSERSKEEK